ncbi:MAG: OmpA family protein [Bacteroidota bacterium]
MLPFSRLFVVVCVTLLIAPGLSAQSILERARRAAERGAERAVEREAERRADRAVTGAIACAMGDRQCARDAEADGKEVVYVDANGEPVEDQDAAAQATRDGSGSAAPDTTRPGTGIWANYDFVPGDRVLYYHDFEGTRTGNFPSRLDYIAGTLDVVEMTEGGMENKVLRVGEGTSEGGPGGNGCFTIPLPEALPERYTMQFRVRTSDPQRRARVRLFSDGSDDTPDTRCNYPPDPHVVINNAEQGLKLPGGVKAMGDIGFQPDTWYDVAVAVDGPYWKMYVNGTRVSNVPRVDFPRASKLHVFMNVYRHSLFLDDLRIAEGGPRSLYDDLEADGFVSTTGILFDTGSARIKPESTPTLNEVLDMLEDHGDLSLLIEGHTDSDGGDASNQTLSEDRAAAVKAYLVDNGIDASRLDTAGRGESEPVADNGTPEGKAQNRRVVFRRRG